MKINKKYPLLTNAFNKEDLDSLISFLIEKKYFFNAYEDRMMFVGQNKQENYNDMIVARVYGITDFNSFSPPYLFNELSIHDMLKKPQKYPHDTFVNTGRQESDLYCYIGYNQSINLNLDGGEKLNIASILDFKNLIIISDTYFLLDSSTF